MKYLVVLFDDVALMGAPFDNRMYLDGYKELHDRAIKKDIKLIFSRGGSDAYMGESRFKNCSTFAKDSIVAHEDTVADIVLDKSKYFVPEDSLNCINDNRIKVICRDKTATFDLFTSISPHTELIDNSTQLMKSIESNSEKRIVLKPIDGSAGEGVIIDIAKNVDISVVKYPVLIQEFIDSSAGIEGLVDGIHDLRIVVSNGDIIFSFLRTPGTDSYLAGIASGGKVTPISLDKIPKKVIDIKYLVDQEFRFSNKRLYSIDLAYNGSEYKLIELNSQPGISGTNFQPEYAELQSGIIKLVESLI